MVRHAQAALRQKVLVDTPDIDSALRSHIRLTAELVHCADIVLFVTSPEKYKVAQSLGWIAQQREQRALAFVLNKWDGESLGRQRALRDRIEDDFRRELNEVGFPDPVLFRVSSLIGEGAKDDGIENEIERLREWLESALDRSTAADVQRRRRRAAWGRIGAAVAAARPTPLKDHGFLVTTAKRFEAWRVQGTAAAQATSMMVPFPTLAGDARPVTPGLYGQWTRLMRHMGDFAASLRGRITLLVNPLRSILRDPASATTPAMPGFEAASLEDLAGWLEKEALATRFPCGPVPSIWSEQARAFSERLQGLPAEVEQQIAKRQQARSVRRFLGSVVLYGTDVAMTAVLLLGLWRLAKGYAIGTYVAAGLIGNAVALLVALWVAGELLGGLFFPRLKDAAKLALAQAVTDLFRQVAADAQGVIVEHVRAAEDLIAEGNEILDGIHRIVGEFNRSGPDIQPVVDRLFGTEIGVGGSNQSPATGDAASTEPVDRRPVFN
jgi:hypothetical protein